MKYNTFEPSEETLATKASEVSWESLGFCGVKDPARYILPEASSWMAVDTAASGKEESNWTLPAKAGMEAADIRSTRLRNTMCLVSHGANEASR